MRSNYHNIRAIVNNIHNYSEIIHGATESIQSIFRANVIYIKNTIATKLLIKSKTDKNIVQITNKEVNTSLSMKGKLDNNNVIVKNAIYNKLFSKIFPDISNIKIVNSLLLYIAKIINVSNNIIIKNSFRNILLSDLIPKNDDNIIIENNINSHLNIKLDDSQNNNDITIAQPEVNAAAWRMTRLGDMKGTLGSYVKMTLEETGRTKIV